MLSKSVSRNVAVIVNKRHRNSSNQTAISDYKPSFPWMSILLLVNKTITSFQKNRNSTIKICNTYVCACSTEKIEHN